MKNSDLADLMIEASKRGYKIYRRRLVEEQAELNVDVANALKDKFSLQNDIGWDFERSTPLTEKTPLFDVECGTEKHKNLTLHALIQVLTKIVNKKVKKTYYMID